MHQKRRTEVQLAVKSTSAYESESSTITTSISRREVERSSEATALKYASNHLHESLSGTSLSRQSFFSEQHSISSIMALLYSSYLNNAELEMQNYLFSFLFWCPKVGRPAQLAKIQLLKSL